jgi:DNA-binding NarL/FixJ family response regulator
MAPAPLSDLEVLHGICHAFGSTADIREALTGTVRWIRAAVGSDEVPVRIWLADPAGGLSLAFVDSEPDATLAERAALESAVRSKRPRMVASRADDDAVGVLPLVSRGTVYGAVELRAHARLLERRWQTVVSVASQTAIVLRNLAERERAATVLVGAGGAPRPVLVPPLDQTEEADNDPRRILVVVEQRLFAEAIKRALEHRGDVVQIATSGEAATAAALVEKPDVVLVDTELPDGTAMEFGAWALDRWHDTVVIALTASRDRRSLDQAIRAGFSGYMTRDTGVSKLIASIDRAGRRNVITSLDRHRLGRGGARVRSEAAVADNLTARELEILALLVHGSSSKEMARWLGLSRHTVRTHVQNILAKLGAHSRLEAATYALLFGLVDPELAPRTPTRAGDP